MSQKSYPTRSPSFVSPPLNNVLERPAQPSNDPSVADVRNAIHYEKEAFTTRGCNTGTGKPTVFPKRVGQVYLTSNKKIRGHKQKRGACMRSGNGSSGKRHSNGGSEKRNGNDGSRKRSRRAATATATAAPASTAAHLREVPTAVTAAAGETAAELQQQLRQQKRQGGGTCTQGSCKRAQVGKHDEDIYEDDGDGRQRRPTTAIANASTNAPRECANDGKQERARATETSPGR
ncbi:hypothetical protein PILCRDRAFT_14208 [Piloderma croceum F 1598]|uniref:Uncharacterized protein n=1 Tax=Piloderma croceum (strain F 1598) TaxID=765440 RepID=A0A0C3F446_PILCF|nr:hypothetical protein PILCRDRAFT_14208 [Piloderma croceum F 1598]